MTKQVDDLARLTGLAIDQLDLISDYLLAIMAITDISEANKFRKRWNKLAFKYREEMGLPHIEPK